MRNVETVSELPSHCDRSAGWSSIDMFDAGAFALGACCAIPFQAMGRLYLGEVLLSAFAFVLFLRWIMRPDRLDSLVVKFCGFVFVSGLGYFLSDLYRGTPLTDVIRGIGKWTILLSCIVSLSWLGLNDFRRFCILVTGWALAFCVFPQLLDRSLTEMIQMNPWKFIYAFPVTLVLAYLAHGKRWLTLLLFMGVAVLSAILDSRAFSLMSMVAAACVLVCSLNRKQNVFLVSVVVLICCAGGALMASKVAHKFDYSDRQDTSTYWRMASFNMGIEAIKRSPFIGYGTWARQIELADYGDQLFEEYSGQKAFRFSWQLDYVEAHSQLLESWVQGGILGVTFFAFLGFQTVATLRYMILDRRYRPECPFLLILFIHGLWHLLFSPFGAEHRLLIAFSIVAICWLHREAAESKE